MTQRRRRQPHRSRNVFAKLSGRDDVPHACFIKKCRGSWVMAAASGRRQPLLRNPCVSLKHRVMSLFVRQRTVRDGRPFDKAFQAEISRWRLG